MPRYINADKLEELCDIMADKCDGIGESIWNQFRTVVEYSPTVDVVERKWVPIAERLPNPYQQCWFTTTDGEVEQHHFDGLISRYKAWMPFEKPEPWKGEKDG